MDEPFCYEHNQMNLILSYDEDSISQQFAWNIYANFINKLYFL